MPPQPQSHPISLHGANPVCLTGPISKGLLQEAALPACPAGRADRSPHQAPWAGLGIAGDMGCYHSKGSAPSRSSRNRHRINQPFLFVPCRAGCLPGYSPVLAKQTKVQNPTDLGFAERISALGQTPRHQRIAEAGPPLRANPLTHCTHVGGELERSLRTLQYATAAVQIHLTPGALCLDGS